MISMLAGESLEVQVWTLFDEGDLLPHDWQLVTLASVEEVGLDENKRLRKQNEKFD